MADTFRIKPYAHRDYKFVVRAKIGARWKRRYFRTEQEAAEYADQQNNLTELAPLSHAPPPEDETGSSSESLGPQQHDYLASSREPHEIAELKAALEARTGELAALQEHTRALEALANQASQDLAELSDARWDLLTLRADFLRQGSPASDAVSRLAEMEDRANAATAERDHLRGLIVALQNDLEQERLNIAALQHHIEIAPSDTAAGTKTEDAPDVASILDLLEAARAEMRLLRQQLYAVEDRASIAEAGQRTATQRAATSENQLQTIQAQWRVTQDELRKSGKELASRRNQILHLRERLARRLILPFGKMQRHLDELTR